MGRATGKEIKMATKKSIDNVESLSEFQLRDGAPEGFDERTFVINDEGQATWAMRKLAVSQRRIDVLKRQAQEEVARIERWVASATKSDQTTVEYFSGALEGYMRRIRLDDGRKSLSLPDGTVKSREVAEKVKVEDLDVFLKWAEQTGHLDWVRVKQEADLATMKSKVFYSGGCVVDGATGETIDGLSHVPASISVSVEVSE